MTTEKENMLSGHLYDPLDSQLSEERLKARLLLKALNDSPENDQAARRQILAALIPAAGPGFWL